MRTSLVGAAIIAAAAAVASAVAVGMLRGGDSAQTLLGDSRTSTLSPSPGLMTAAGQQVKPENIEAQLTERLTMLARSAEGDIGVAVIHVESGRAAAIEGGKQLPLYSVFKLPLAVAVLQDVEKKQLSLDKKVQVLPSDVAPGSQFNTDLWRGPVEKTIAELLEYSIVRSDNTSSDKLLQLVGGPAGLTQRMRALGFANIDIKSTTREFAERRDNPNTGTASDLGNLLAKLQQGEILQPPQLSLLVGFMARSMTGGERRLRADLPTGTQVADKTGTGGSGSATNDVGLITLPEGKGHLAMAVLLSGSKLSVAAQEKVIAQLARAAYDSYVLSPGAK